MITTAYKSEHTGELFETEEEYMLHLSEYEKEKAKNDRITRLKERRKEIIDTPRNTATSIEDFRLKMFDVITELNEGNPDQLLGLFFEGLSFGNCSNSHCRPIDGIQNWGHKAGSPTSYPGWTATTYIVLSEQRNTGQNRDKIETLLRYFPGFNLGSGNGSGNSSHGGINGYLLTYQSTFFINDFPLMKKEYYNFLKFSELRNEWDIEVSRLCDARRESDGFLISRNADKVILQNQINELTSKMYVVDNEISARDKENMNQILSENKFVNSVEFEALSKKFKSRY